MVQLQQEAGRKPSFFMDDCYVWLVCYKGQKHTYEYACNSYDEAVELMSALKIKRPDLTGWYVVEKDVS